MEFYRRQAEKPPLSPPPLAFPIVWGVLFVLMGVGAARAYLSGPSRERTCALRVFFLQLAFNFCWSLIFFNLLNFGLAFIWLIVLWALILWMIFAFYKLDRPAAWLQIPYLGWATFAAYLNLGVWILN